MFQFSRTLYAPREGSDGGFGTVPAIGEKVYAGECGQDGVCHVWVEDDTESGTPSVRQRRPLALHLEVRAHSPTGFAWGYGGSGPAQLALALLTDAVGDPALAEQHYQAFKWKYVARWENTWFIGAREIRAFVAASQMLLNQRFNWRCQP